MAKKALNGIYINMATPSLYGENLTMTVVDILGQYYDYPGNDSKLNQYNYTDGRTLSSFDAIWSSGYQLVLNANSFLDKIENTPMDGERKNILKGEAYAIRAMMQFDLLRLFGPVYKTDAKKESIPYFTTATDKIQPLLPAEDVMMYIITDFDTALELLKNDPIRKEGVVKMTGLDPKNDFYKLRNRRLNYYAVLGLKARALLYKGDKPGAFLAAKSVIEEGGNWFPWTAPGQTEPNTLNPDRSFSNEIIFGIQNYDMYDHQRTLFASELQINEIIAPTDNRLKNIFNDYANDFRYRVNFKWAQGDGKNYRTFIKYQDVADKSLLFRNFQSILRLSELYYIAAECSTNPSEALLYLNTVLTKRGWPALELASAVQNELKNEYIREFWGEGQAFYYYKRNALTSIEDASGMSNIQMTAAKYVLPLPASETDNRRK